ncbi:MAG TPA: hypothetical protein VI318_12465 [Baekduia sp.]
MPADLPALEKLTHDVVAAMHRTERREHRRHGSRARRRLGLLALLMLLLIPSGLVLHTTSSPGATLPDQHHAYDFAKAAGAGAAGAIVAAAVTRAAPRSAAITTPRAALR